jgi:hypothetical protein
MYVNIIFRPDTTAGAYENLVGHRPKHWMEFIKLTHVKVRGRGDDQNRPALKASLLCARVEIRSKYFTCVEYTSPVAVCLYVPSLVPLTFPFC